MLILAAGMATRFGSDKRQASLPDGRSLLEAVVATHRKVFDDVWVLTRPSSHGHDAFAQAVSEAHGAHCMACDDAALGQGHTLAQGLKALTALMALPGHGADARPVDAALVSLADMPWVQADTLRRLLDRFASTGKVVVPRCGEAIGHPRLLPRSVWPHLLGKHSEHTGKGLHGDHGARHLLDWHTAEQVSVDDTGVLRDIDTPDDLIRRD